VAVVVAAVVVMVIETVTEGKFTSDVAIRQGVFL